MNACRVCGNTKDNQRLMLQERYFGLGDAFEYLECRACGSFSIRDIPESMERYYPANYYSYARRSYNRIAGWLRGRRDRHYLGSENMVGRLVSRRSPAPPYIGWLKNLGLPYGSSILEVGSGAGTLIVNLQDAGFPSLGIDPYVAAPVAYANGAKVLKQSLAGTTGAFDCIMLHHCLEHMEAPGEVFRHVHRLLKPGGRALVRIPVAGTHAGRTYGVNWFQLDAPRHFVIFTEAALLGLAERSGFLIAKIIYDSQASQFWASEQYVQGIALTSERSYALNPARSIFTPEQIAEYDKQAALLNARNDGDQSAYYFQKVG